MITETKDMNIQISSHHEKIVLIAEQLLLRKGLQGFTMDQVASASKIAKGTIYNYFKSKNHLLSEVAVKVLHKLIIQWKLILKEDDNELNYLKSILTNFFVFANLNKTYFELILFMENLNFEDCSINYKVKNLEVQQLLVAQIEKAQASGDLRKDINVLESSYMIHASCIGVIRGLQHNTRFKKTRSQNSNYELMAFYADIMISGMKVHR